MRVYEFPTTWIVCIYSLTAAAIYMAGDLRIRTAGTYLVLNGGLHRNNGNYHQREHTTFPSMHCLMVPGPRFTAAERIGQYGGYTSDQNLWISTNPH